MKKALLVLTMVLGFQVAQAGLHETAEIEVTWKKKFAEYPLTMMCDDTYYSTLELTVDGLVNRDFKIIFGNENAVDVEVIRSGKGPKTKFIIDLNSDNTLIEIEQNGTGKKAIVDITESC